MAPLFKAESAIEKNEGIHAPAPIVGVGLLCRIVAYGLYDLTRFAESGANGQKVQAGHTANRSMLPKNGEAGGPS